MSIINHQQLTETLIIIHITPTSLLKPIKEMKQNYNNLNEEKQMANIKVENQLLAKKKRKLNNETPTISSDDN